MFVLGELGVVEVVDTWAHRPYDRTVACFFPADRRWALLGPRSRVAAHGLEAAHPTRYGSERPGGAARGPHRVRGRMSRRREEPSRI